MTRMAVDQIITRSGTAWARKELWRGLLDEAYKYTSPQQNTYNNTAEGQKKDVQIFDNIGVVATRRAVNKYVSAVFPAEQNWCLLKAGPGVKKEEQKSLNEKLQAATELMFSVIHNRSNFQTSITEVAREMWISTGVLLPQKGRTPSEPVIFNCIPQNQVAFGEGPNGTVGDKFRKFLLPGNLITATWRNAKLPETVQKEIADDPDKKYEVIECIYTDYDSGKVYHDVVLSKEKARIVENNLRMDRFIVGRLDRSPDEVQGRGPVLDGLSDIKTINKLVELVLKNATLAVSGPYTVVDDGIVNPDNIIIGPMRMIAVARNPGHTMGASIAPLERSGDFNIAFMEYERLQNSIKAALLDEQLPSLEGQPRTAAEILARVRSYVEDTGSFYSRTKSEVIIPTTQNVLDILAHDWQMIDPVIIDGHKIVLEITSPLAMQRNIQEVEAVVQGMEISKSMFGPEQTAMVFKTEEIIPWIARKLNVPEILLMDKTDQEAIREGAAGALTSLEQVEPGAGLNVFQQAVRG
jgi:hypothetical protein